MKISRHLVCWFAFLPGMASAQQLPTLTLSGTSITLAVPYVEYTATSPASAYALSLVSADGGKSFSVAPGSLAAVTANTASSEITTPYLFVGSSGLTLQLPYLPLSGVAYRAALVMNSSGFFVFDAASIGLVLQSALTAPANVKVSAVDTRTVGSNSFASSSKLRVGWTAPGGYSVTAYQIVATEGQRGASQTFSAKPTDSELTLTGLKAGTPYAVVVKACKNDSCSEAGIAEAVSATTSEEYWQLQGSGNSYTTATKVVSNGSTLSYVIRFGSEAGSSLSGKSQYYYKSAASGKAGIAIATTAGSGADSASLSAFTSGGGGLWQTCVDFTNFSGCPTGEVFTISAVQALPLKSKSGVRLFFEAANMRDKAQTTRIYYLDSQDGYTGQDFNKGSATSCGGNGSTDYGAGGNCEPTLAIGVDSDTTSGGNGLTHARQFKIGYPILDNWRWDESAGSFMVITGSDKCSSVSNSLFYATWSGSAWAVAKDSKGCPQAIVSHAHGPVLTHLGAARYKLYYEDDTNGNNGKPLRMIYGDGALSGSASNLEPADWESSQKAREVHFLWPNGAKLNAEEESGLGDHMIFMPTASTDLQYMYVNLGGFDNANWAAASAGLGMAALLNP